MSTLKHLRAYRARLAEGKKIYKLCLNEVGVEEMLKRAGLLSPDNEDHRAVEKALTRFVQLAIDEETSFDP